MKLSRKGWNNVILLAVFLMILIFNITGKMAKSTNELAGILPDKAQIIAISIEQQFWQKSDKGWQSNEPQPDLGLAAQAIEQWQTQKLSLWLEPVGGTIAVKRIKVQLAQLATPIDLSLFYSPNKILITNWQGQLLTLSPAQFDLLVAPLLSIKAQKVEA